MDWMKNLPPQLTSKPLATLSIPGSHDSFTNTLNLDSPVGCDLPTYIRRIGRYRFIRKIVYRWAKTQNIGPIQQLRAGIRYFDFRIIADCTYSDVDRDVVSDERKLFIVHGLYGGLVRHILDQIASYLNENPKEVVILDFNHFYRVTVGDYQRLLREIETSFSVGRLTSTHAITSFDQLTLDFMWTNGYQVIAVSSYRGAGWDDINPAWMWNSSFIESPYLNTDRLVRLFAFLRDHLVSRKHQKRKLGFFVTQAILTPTYANICAHPWSSREKCLAKRCTRQFASWIQTFDDPSVFNVVICDYIECTDFCSVVVALNYRKSWEQYS